MGLRNADTLLAMGVITGLVSVLGLFGEPGREALAYVRSDIAGGEIWRLVSGHFVHLGWPHLALNMAGLWLVWYLVADRYPQRQWLLIITTVIAGIDLGFWLLEPQLAWYVGLSGVLHGLLAAGVVAGMHGRNPESWWLAGILLAKLGYEQFVGPIPGSEASAGGPVIVAAHLYGALSGVVIATLLLIRVRTKATL